MNKRCNVIENTNPPTKAKSVLFPLIGVFVFSGLLFWTFNHISGGCIDAKDVLSYCDGMPAPPTLR